MEKTVKQAFQEFLENSVNLNRKATEDARKSRDNLKKNISEFGSDEDFFTLYEDFNIDFGSFARKTKCRELDDIDMMIGISANYATYNSEDSWDNTRIYANKSDVIQNECMNDDGTLNSKMVVNKFKEKLKKVNEYSKAEIKRNYEAVVLNLKSKTWNFDIVPCFYTAMESDGRNYYLIPNGNGNWKKTDPRKDREKIKEINKKHNGKVLELIRLVKKWNNKKIPSYLLETLCIYYFENKNELESINYIEFVKILPYVSFCIQYPVKDIKEIQEDINTLDDEKIRIIVDKITNEICIATEALSIEKKGDMKKSIELWKKIFGEEFPDYE